MQLTFVSFIFLLLLSACTNLHSPKTTFQPERMALKLSPQSFGHSITLQQHITAQYGIRQEAFDAVLQINPQQIKLVGLFASKRFITLTYDGKTLQTWRDPHVPAQITGENVLEDIQLTLWPIKAIRQALPQGWQIQSNRHTRIIYLHTQPVVMIQYLNKTPENGTTSLHNLRYNYHLTIQSVVS